MKIYTNEKLIHRNRRIGTITTIASLVILGLGLFLSFQGSTQLVTYSFLALILGFVLSQIGIYMGNRFGRHPRVDETVDNALKGLDDRYSLFHYATPVSHLLLGPAGIWVVLPYAVGNTVVFEKNRFRQKGRGVGSRFFSLFTQEGLGRPDLDVSTNVSDLERFFEKNMPDQEIPIIRAVLVFTNEKANLEVEDAPTPALPLKKFKEFVRRMGKETNAPTEMIDKVIALFTA